MPQPHRGDRVQTQVRLPRPMREAAEAIAARDGIGVGDVVTKLVGEALDLPIPDYCLPKPQQAAAAQDEALELPLTNAS